MLFISNLQNNIKKMYVNNKEINAFQFNSLPLVLKTCPQNTPIKSFYYVVSLI